jgi:hypothetical protein
MTPLFLRGSLLITEKIISYNEFMEMTFKDFKRIESTYYFMTNMKNGVTKTANNNETIEKLSKLDTVNINDLDLPEVYKEIF